MLWQAILLTDEGRGQRSNNQPRYLPGIDSLRTVVHLRRPARLTLRTMPALQVLHVNTEPGWRGGENQVYLLHRGLVAAGIDSTVLCRAGEPLAARLRAEHLPHATISAGPLFTLRTARAIRDAATHGAIIHAHASAAHTAACLGVCATSAPLIVTRRVDFALKRGLIARWKYGRRVTHFVAISNAVAEILRCGGVDPARILVIPSAGQLSDVKPDAFSRDTLHLPADHLIVLCAAALVDHKGHRHLLDAWRQIEAHGVRATLLLAGSGEREAELRAQASGLNNVRFLGWRDDLPQLLRAADLFTLASVEEGLGSVLIDAQLAGLPIVATTAGGIPEVVADGRSGLLVSPADPTALAAALTRALTDSALRAILAAGARLHGRLFSVDTMVARYQALYAKLHSS